VLPFTPSPPKEAAEYRLWRERQAGLLDEQVPGLHRRGAKVPERRRDDPARNRWSERKREELDERVEQDV
jgi:hypothetical protein